jgi:DNA repair exonuclease SbcCD nuclease subunit
MFNNFHIFEKPQTIEINSHKILMLPWIENVADLKTAVQLHNSADYIMCHADVKGFSLNKMTKLSHGLEYDDLTKFKKVYSGHIHIRQANHNVVYVGTPYEMDRGDRGNTKGFYVLDASETNLTEKFIENTFSPKHIKPNILDLLNMNSDQIRLLFNNNFVDILIDSNFLESFPIAKFTELIKDFGHRRIDFISYNKDQVKTKSEIELNSNYEYNIFNILKEKLDDPNIPINKHQLIISTFESIFNNLKNAKNYES